MKKPFLKLKQQELKTELRTALINGIDIDITIENWIVHQNIHINDSLKFILEINNEWIKKEIQFPIETLNDLGITAIEAWIKNEKLKEKLIAEVKLELITKLNKDQLN